MIGVIKAVAQTQCGGKDGLDEAIRCGDVRVGTMGTRTMYFFPKLDAGKGQKAKASTIGSRKKDTSMEAFNAWQNATESMNWELGGETAETGAAPLADGPTREDRFCFIPFCSQIQRI